MTSLDPALLPGDRPISLMIRHAERPPIVHGHVGLELALTEGGRAASRELGAALHGRVRSARTSPMQRCRETAELVCAGAGASVDILDDPILGEPSIVVVDRPVALGNWERLGNDGVIEHLATSDDVLPGMRGGEETAQLLLAHLLGPMVSSDETGGDAATGIHLFVTHDIMVATFVSRSLHLGKPIWPGYLAGAAVWRDGSDVRMAFDGQIHTLPR